MADSKDRRVDYDDVPDIDSSIVTVVLKTRITARPYPIHRDVLIFSSEYFRQAVKEAESEKQSRITITDCSCWNFKAYRTYIYSGRVACRLIAASDESTVQSQYEDLVDLHRLGVKFKDGGFQDACISAILAAYQEAVSLHQTRHLPGTSLVHRVYSSTDNPKLRKLIVDMYLMDADAGHIGDVGALPEAFMHDLIKVLLGSRKQPGSLFPTDRSCCSYHVHQADAACNHKKRKREGD